MASKLRQFVVVAALVVVAGASCKGKGSPAGPSLPPPVPDQSQYEQLPAFHPLTDAGGNPTKMWTNLISVSPMRGSNIVLNQSFPPCLSSQANPNSCFRYQLEVGFNQMTNPHLVATFDLWFSQDGKAPSENGTTIGFGSVKPGQSIKLGGGDGTPQGGGAITIVFTEVPKYLLVIGAYRGSTSEGILGESGSTSFLLDYRPPR